MQLKDEDSNWPRQLVIALGALLAAALVIGGVVSMVALAAADFAGVGSQGPAASEEPSLYIPPPASPSSTPDVPEESEQPTQNASAEPEKSDQPKKKRRDSRRQITLSASPKSGATYERIYLTGTYRGGNGATLQVQRYEGRWVDFPVSATVRGGGFETWVESGKDGRNRFRVVDESTGRASKPVSVTLR